MCTVFMNGTENATIMAKNYDVMVISGMIYVNQRGRKKKSLVMPTEKEFVWKALFGSVTFSQSGKGMPSCGINEKGLIVEQANLFETLYPQNQNGKVSTIEAIQYILDTCENIEMAKKAFSGLNISNESARLHYFLTDKSGNGVIIEFLDGKMKCYEKENMPVSVITNSVYDFACKKVSVGESPYAIDSIRRFEIVKSELEKKQVQKHTDGRIEMSVEEAFRILKEANREDTVWHIVYDIKQNDIYFGFKDGKTKKIDMDSIDFSENAISLLYDMESESSFRWQQYTREMNRKNIEKFYQNKAILEVLHLPSAEFVIQAIDEHENNMECELL